MNVPSLTAARRPEGAAGPGRLCAVYAEVDPSALAAHLAARRGDLARDGQGVFERAAAVARVYDRWFTAHGVPCPLPGQIEATARKGLPSIGPAVDTLLYAEMTTGVLMGAQDADAIDGDLRFDWAKESETFPGLRAEVVCSAGEPVVRDGTAIVASVLRGPDRRTAASKRSRRLVFTVYDVPGLPAEEFDGAVQLLCDLLKGAGSVPEVNEVAL